MTEITVPISLISTITTLPTCTPKLEVLTFHFGGDWEGRRRVTVQTEADEALTSLPHLCEAHFIVDADISQGSLARRVREQLPLSSAADLLHFSITAGRGAGRGGWYAECFDDPELALLDVWETWEREESPDADVWAEYHSGDSDY
jgi:hypothetical protein